MIRIGGGNGGGSTPSGVVVKGLRNGRPLGYVSVAEFGAVLDGVTNDTQALTAAVAACNAGDTLHIPPSAGMLIQNPIVIPAGIHVLMEAPLIYAGPDTGPALTIGAVAGSIVDKLRLTLNVVRQTISDWTTENSVGIRLSNIATSNIDVIQASGFTIGVQCYGAAQGFVYNKVTLLDIMNNKVGLDLTNVSLRMPRETLTTTDKQLYRTSSYCAVVPAPQVWVDGVLADPSTYTVVHGAGIKFNSAKSGTPVVEAVYSKYGWCNENQFFNGRFGSWGSTYRSKDRYGVRITTIDGSYPYNNNNIFYKPSFELAGDAARISVLIEYGMQNEFQSCRSESEGSPNAFAVIKNASGENYFDIGYTPNQYETVDDQSSAQSSVYRSRRTRYIEDTHVPVFNSGALHRLATVPSASNVSIPGIARFADNSITPLASGPGTITPTYLELPTGSTSYGMGVRLETSSARRFVVRRDVEAGYGGRVVVTCFNAAGAQMLQTDANNPLIRGTSFRSIAWFPGICGGSYMTGSDSTDDIYFTVAPSVKYVIVQLMPISSALRLRSFSIATSMSGISSASALI